MLVIALPHLHGLYNSVASLHNLFTSQLIDRLAERDDANQEPEEFVCSDWFDLLRIGSGWFGLLRIGAGRENYPGIAWNSPDKPGQNFEL
jgi:hypothetical protein